MFNLKEHKSNHEALYATNEVFKTCQLLADQLLCLPPVLGSVAGSLPLPVCKTNQIPGLPNLPKIPGLPI
jgi:hypothetical protein